MEKEVANNFTPADSDLQNTDDSSLIYLQLFGSLPYDAIGTGVQQREQCTQESVVENTGRTESANEEEQRQ